jgi:glutaredoxin
MKFNTGSRPMCFVLLLGITLGLLVESVCSFIPRTTVAPRSTAKIFMSVPNALDTLTSGLASICRLPRGITVSSTTSSSAELRLLKLYDIENSRECRSVREYITEYDLIVEKVISAAENSRAITDKIYSDALPVGQSVPCLVVGLRDGSEETISGKTEIVSFLEKSFGSKTVIATSEEEKSIVEKATELVLQAGYYSAGVLRSGRGCRVSPAATSSARVRRPEKPLVLYSYEGNQFCRLVREVMTELDIVYELRSAGKGSPRRAELAELTGGSSQCPHLVDPNNGKSLSESADIIQYLYGEYALWTPPSELLEWASKFIMSTAKPIFGALAPVQAGSTNLEEAEYNAAIQKAKKEIEKETNTDVPLVVYTYSLSPFSSETILLLKRLQVDFKEISLGMEWIPGLMIPGGAEKRAALLEMTGQSSLPHIFIGGKPIGGLYSGNPGLLPLLEADGFQKLVDEATKSLEFA